MTQVIKHYGILGMHWGVTTGGKSGGRGGGRNGFRRGGGRSGSKTSEDYRNAAALRGKKKNELTTEELKVLTGRLQLEKKFSELTKRDLSVGEKFVGGMIVSFGAQTTGALVALAAAKTVSAVVDYIQKRIPLGSAAG